jgi:hypothetical protein
LIGISFLIVYFASFTKYKAKRNKCDAKRNYISVKSNLLNHKNETETFDQGSDIERWAAVSICHPNESIAG